jgi:hypothetical protein
MDFRRGQIHGVAAKASKGATAEMASPIVRRAMLELKLGMLEKLYQPRVVCGLQRLR